MQWLSARGHDFHQTLDFHRATPTATPTATATATPVLVRHKDITSSDVNIPVDDPEPTTRRHVTSSALGRVNLIDSCTARPSCLRRQLYAAIGMFT